MTMPRRQSAPVLDRLIVLHIPGPETVDDYGQRIPGPATDYRVWASRQDVTARDMQLDLDNDQRLKRPPDPAYNSALDTVTCSQTRS